MSNENIFEKALRLRITFQYKGTANLYDIWSLSLEELDKIYRELDKEFKIVNSEGDGLLSKRTSKTSSTLKLKMDIIRHVFEVLQQEKIKSDRLAERRRKSQELLSIISMKEGDELKGKSIEELRRELTDLQNEDD